MTQEQVHKMVETKAVPHPTEALELVETHASWVLLADAYAYKLKKPLRFSFLDFSTLEKRKTYCEREVTLNQRLAPEMYLGVLPVIEQKGRFLIGEGSGNIVDFAVWMRRMEEHRQLDLLLEAGDVKGEDMRQLAAVLADFHRRAKLAPVSEDWEALYEEFADIGSLQPQLKAWLGEDAGVRIAEVNQWAYGFLFGIRERIEQRKEAGFVIDGHGDLHCRNIFLLDPPVIFDCIEFSEELRTLDMLNEAAFLCMDLERFGRDDLSAVFMEHYQSATGVIENKTDQQLFLYYKMYRANVRMKVHSLQLLEREKDNRENGLDLVRRYFELFERYYMELRGPL